MDDRINEALSLSPNIVIDKNTEGWDQNMKDVNHWIERNILTPLNGRSMPPLLNILTIKEIKHVIMSFLPRDKDCPIMNSPVSKLFLYVQPAGLRMFCKAADGNFQYAASTLILPEEKDSIPVFITDLKPGLEALYKLRYDSVFQGNLQKFEEFMLPLLKLLLAHP